LAAQAKAELAAVMSKMCDENAEYMIGRMYEPLQSNRGLWRVEPAGFLLGFVGTRWRGAAISAKGT